MESTTAMETDPFIFRVVDLKQYVFCPRVAYYHIILPRVRPVTYHMSHGTESHVHAEGRERRRSLGTYGIGEGDRYFKVPLWSPDLGLSGELDLLIQTATERIPVDYKDSERVGAHFELQLMAYACLLEEKEGEDVKPIKRGFLYLIPLRKAIEVKFTPRLRQDFDNVLASIRAIAASEHMPEPTDRRGRCLDCEFRRFCNDVV